MNISENTTPRIPIWDRSPEDVAHWSHTLSRVVSISKQLESSKIQEIVEDWSSFQAELCSQKDPASALEKLKTRIAPFSESLQTIYLEDFNQPQKDVAARINRLGKDFFSALNLSIQESFHGNDGVLLIRHTRGGSENQSAWIEKSVIKWSSPVEVASCDILRNLLDKTDEFYVHSASMLDFDNGIFIQKNSNTTFPKDLSNQIQGNLNEIRSRFTTKETSFTNIMISEKINGTNLADFIVNNWNALSSVQKEAVFKSIGKLAFADLLMGNGDRFTMFDMDFVGFDEYFEANIGNLMISVPKDKETVPTLYPIDNAIQLDNLVDGRDYAEYNRAFQQLLEKSDWSTSMSHAILGALTASFRMESAYFEGIKKEKRTEVQEKLESFIGDLKDLKAEQHFSSGLSEMKETLVSKFDEAFFSFLETINNKYSASHKDQNSPLQLSLAVKTRIETLLNTKG